MVPLVAFTTLNLIDAGVVDTPGFVPVATNAVIKHLTSRQLHDIGTQLIFCNTYHLAVHPGTEVD